MPNSNSALAPGLRLQPSSPSSQSTTPSPSSTTSQPSNQQERYWTHHTHTALESALASTHKDTIILSADVDDVASNSSSSSRSAPPTLSSTAGFSDDSIKPEPLTPKMKTADFQQRTRQKTSLGLKLTHPETAERSPKPANPRDVRQVGRVEDGEPRACHKHGQAVSRGPRSTSATSRIIFEVNPPHSFSKTAPLTDPSEPNRLSMTSEPFPFSFLFLFRRLRFVVLHTPFPRVSS